MGQTSVFVFIFIAGKVAQIGIEPDDLHEKLRLKRIAYACQVGTPHNFHSTGKIASRHVREQVVIVGDHGQLPVAYASSQIFLAVGIDTRRIVLKTAVSIIKFMDYVKARTKVGCRNSLNLFTQAVDGMFVSHVVGVATLHYIIKPLKFKPQAVGKDRGSRSACAEKDK